MEDTEDPERSLIEVEGLEEEIGEQMTQVVMEDTGVHTTRMLHAGRYTGTAAVHEVYLAKGRHDRRHFRVRELKTVSETFLIVANLIPVPWTRFPATKVRVGGR